MSITKILIIGLLVLVAGCKGKNMDKTAKETASLIILENNNIEVGILPEAGGRIVLLRQPGKKNILKSDPALWDSAKKQPEISVNTEFIAYNGHIVWLGPQNEWWVHQNLHTDRKAAQAPWPPDPYLVAGNYTITAQSDTKIHLQSPESAVSGIQLTKIISITDNGTVKFEVTGQNIRDSIVKWDLWLNTRLPGTARFYVPVDDDGIMRISSEQNNEKDTMQYTVEQGFFTFDPQKPTKGKQNRIAKAFLHPSDNYIIAFNKRQAFILRIPMHEKKSIHPEQALIEIYNQVGNEASDHLLELEYHAPYKKLQPGEKMKTSQTWELMEYNGENNPQAHIKFIKSIM